MWVGKLNTPSEIYVLEIEGCGGDTSGVEGVKLAIPTKLARYAEKIP